MTQLDLITKENDLDPNEEGCCHRTKQCLDPRYEPIEWCMGMALFALITGIILITLGYVVPRDWEVNPDLSARKMEAIEKYYIRLNNILDGCTMAGLVLIALGGVILSTIVTMLFCNGELIPLCEEGPQEEDETMVLTPRGSSQASPGASSTKQYGSTNEQCSDNGKSE